MTTFFDVVKCINEKVGDVQEMKDANNPFMVNRALSMVQDTVFYANEMNHWYDLSKDQQFDFYYNLIPKGKRYGKWIKADSQSDDINIVAQVYGVSERLAEQYMKLLTADQLEVIKNKNMKGGKNASSGGKGKAKET